MKKLAMMIVMTIVAFLGMHECYALSPELKQIQDELNKELPMSFDEGVVLEKFQFVNDNKMELSFSAESLADIKPADIDKNARQAFRSSFLGSLGGDSNPLVQIAKGLNMDIQIKVYNPSKELVINEIFKPSDL